MEAEAKDQVLATAEMITDWFYHAYQQRSSMPAETLQGYKNYMRSLYANSAALQEYITQHEDWYPIGFIKAIPGHPKTTTDASDIVAETPGS